MQDLQYNCICSANLWTPMAQNIAYYLYISTYISKNIQVLIYFEVYMYVAIEFS